jgi:hypothetical protein
MEGSESDHQPERMEATYRIVEIPRKNSLLNWSRIIRIRIPFDYNLHSLAQPSQLISDISCTAQRLELQELLVTELLRIVRIGPLLPYVEQCEVVSSGTNEILPGLISMQLLVLRSVEERARFREHGDDCQNLCGRQLQYHSQIK